MCCVAAESPPEVDQAGGMTPQSGSLHLQAALSKHANGVFSVRFYFLCFSDMAKAL